MDRKRKLSETPIEDSAKKSKILNHTKFDEIESTIKEWEFIARVTSKTDVKTYKNGQCFSFDLLDKSNELRCTVFSPYIDKFFDIIKVGFIYSFGNVYINLANKMYNKFNSTYELILQDDSKVISCETDDEEIPLNKYNFKSIADIATCNVNDIIDIIGKVKNIDGITNITLKDGHQMIKRDVLIVDGNFELILVFWNNKANNIQFVENDTLVIKKAKVTEFKNSKKLSILSTTTVEININIPEVKRFKL